MRGSRLLIGIGILVLLAVLSIPAFLIGNGQVYLHAYTLSQHYQLSARYVPQPDLYGPHPDAPYGWRVKGKLWNKVSTYTVSCGSGISSHPPTYAFASAATMVRHVNDWDGMGDRSDPNLRPRQAIIDVLWMEAPQRFSFFTPQQPTVSPSKYFTLALAKAGWPDVTGDGAPMTDAKSCHQQLFVKQYKAFFASPLGWVVIILVAAFALYIIFAGRGGGGGGGGRIYGHSTRHYGGSGSDIRLYGPGGTTTGRSTPTMGPGTSERIWLDPPDFL